jgi:hypothetical protein
VLTALRSVVIDADQTVAAALSSLGRAISTTQTALADAIGTATRSAASDGAGPAPAAIVASLTAAVDRFAEAQSSAINQTHEGLARISENAVREITRLMVSLAPAEPFPAQPADMSPAGRQAASADSPPASHTSSQQQPAATTAAYPTSPGQIADALSRHFRAAPSAPLPDAYQHVRDGLDKARSLVQDLARDLRNLVSNAEARLRAPSTGAGDRQGAGTTQSPQQAASTLTSQAQRLVQATAILLQQVFANLGRQEELIPSVHTQRTSRLLEQALRDLVDRGRDPMQGRAAQEGGPTRSDAATLTEMRQQVEQTLNRLESLQLLARTTTVTEGQQQILALPMRIDGQLTEVRVKLVKRRNEDGRSPARNGHYSVSVNVAPIFSGEIDVHMEYTAGKALGVRMHFEKGAARQWFQENRAAITGALTGLGFGAVHLEFGTTRPGGALPGSQASGAEDKDGQSPSSRIDMVA